MGLNRYYAKNNLPRLCNCNINLILCVKQLSAAHAPIRRIAAYVLAATLINRLLKGSQAFMSSRYLHIMFATHGDVAIAI